MRTITIAGGENPFLFRRLLQSLVANDLTDWRIFIQVEPSPLAAQYIDAAADLLGRFEYTLTVNPQCLGVGKNSFHLLQYVFRHDSALNINLAEDSLVAADTTRLARWYFDHHRPEWLCLSLLSIARPFGLDSDFAYPNLLFLGKEFASSGFVVRGKEWYHHFENRKAIDETPTLFDKHVFVGWDWSICKHLLRSDKLVSVQPVAARVLRVGRQRARNKCWERRNQALAALAPSLRQITEKPYQMVEPAELPDAIRAQLLPVQHLLYKLLDTIEYKEQVVKDQNDALVKLGWEANDRAKSLSFVLSKLLARCWCALVPVDSWRYRIYMRYIRPRIWRLVIYPVTSIPLEVEVSASSVPVPAPAGVPSRGVRFRGFPRLVSSKDSPVRILILKLDHIGDFLLSISALFLLREAWPDAHFTLVCGPWNVTVASQFAVFDEIHSYNFFSPLSADGIHVGIRHFRQVPLGEYDLAIDLRHDTETRPLLNYVRARYRAGFVCNPQFPVRLDLAIPDLELVSPLEASRNALHSEARLIVLASAIVATFGEYKGCNAQNLVASRPLIRYFDHGPVVALAPGCGNPIKQWGAARFSHVARTLNKEACCRFVLIGGESDKADAAVVAAALPSDQCVNAVGKLDISDVPLALAGVDLFIGNDTGTTHMAALMGIPTVNIFAGIADVNIWRARGPNVITLYAPVPCAPCHLGKLNDCSHGHICLKSISEDGVVASALSFLRRSDLQDTRHEICKVAPREKVTRDTGSVGRFDIGPLVTDQQ
jgi:ADP-heptose:LPS heptosyltransferase